MAVQYDFYKNHSPKDSKKRVRYHARVVPYGTVDTNKLAQRIHSRCTVTPADVKAVLSSLSESSSRAERWKPYSYRRVGVFANHA